MKIQLSLHVSRDRADRWNYIKATYNGQFGNCLFIKQGTRPQDAGSIMHLMSNGVVVVTTPDKTVIKTLFFPGANVIKAISGDRAPQWLYEKCQMNIIGCARMMKGVV